MHYKLLIGGIHVATGDTRIIHSPFSGRTVAIYENAGEKEVEETIKNAKDSFYKFRKSTRYTRSVLLEKIALGIENRKKEIVGTITEEAGKPIKLSELEVSRAIVTFEIASEEAKRYAGDYYPLDSEVSGQDFEPMVSYLTPKGIVLGIAPFNFPLNLIAHKVAPALAIGAPIIIKSSLEAPGASFILGEIFMEAIKFVSDKCEELPGSILQIIYCSNELSSKMVQDKRISVLSFTGSDLVGWNLQSIATRKKVCLELGGNAAVIVHRDADIENAVSRSVFGSFAYAGQVCISVQRIFIQSEIYSEFKRRFLEEVKKLIVGDPTKKDTLVGPIINRKSRDRILSWIEEARNVGATLLTPVNAVENVIFPIVLETVPPEAKILTEEVFGPVVILDYYDDFNEAIEKVNNSRYGLQAGVFTDSDSCMRKAAEDLEVGAVIFNEVPIFRADNMPYGGVKDSGLGREGVKFAMEEFSERKTIIKRRNRIGNK